MSQYFHIKTDITFCLGQGSIFIFKCSLVYMIIAQVLLHA